MTKSIRDNKNNWSRWEEDENNIKIKTADKRITKLFGAKIEQVSEVCSARIIDIVK